MHRLKTLQFKFSFIVVCIRNERNPCARGLSALNMTQDTHYRYAQEKLVQNLKPRQLQLLFKLQPPNFIRTVHNVVECCVL